MAEYYTIGGFTIDDTVLPSGQTLIGAAGGNALYSAIGAKLWSKSVGIIALIGDDYPQPHIDRLAAAGFDLIGVRRVAHPNFRVWILHEAKARRQIIYHLNSGRNEYLDPHIEDLPPGCAAARGVHICPILAASQASLMEHFLDHGVPLFLDLIVIPQQIERHSANDDAAWKRLHGFLPSIEEVKALWGDRPLASLLATLRLVGPPCFTVKLGDVGSLVRNPSDATIYYVPAYATRAIDTTGAGDAYCGGFMVGFQETGDALEGALRGTISASFVVEDFGGLHALDVPLQTAQARLGQLRAQVRAISEAGLAELDLRLAARGSGR